MPATVTYPQILRRAWPLILANCSVPLLGLADTAVLGNLGTLFDLGAIALGALVFSFVYWGFGFLRMGTTGFVAQAAGAGNEAEVRAAAIRSLALGLLLGVTLVALRGPIGAAAFGLLEGSPQVESIAGVYFGLRIWGAPATLGTFALVGVLVGLGESRKLLLVQLFLNALNIALDVWFAGALAMGARGIALGTLIAEWTAFGFAGVLVWRILKSRHGDQEAFVPAARVLERASIKAMLTANYDIMVRTLLLVFSFAWFTNQSARYGDVALAANHILLELISFSAFFLDGYAFVVESFVGLAVGARDRRVFDLAVRKTGVLAAGTALVLACVVLLAGERAIEFLTDLPRVREQAGGWLPLAALYVLVSFGAFQLDGIFIGATRTAQMRNAALLSTLVFLLAWWVLAGRFGLQGLWYAFILYVCARGAALALYYPALREGVGIGGDTGRVTQGST